MRQSATLALAVPDENALITCTGKRKENGESREENEEPVGRKQ